MPTVAMTIPTIREELHKLASAIRPWAPENADRIDELADATKRRPSTFRRAPNYSPKLTDDQVAHIRSLKANHPLWSLQTIAETVGTNIGRVSEVLSGKRDGS